MEPAISQEDMEQHGLYKKNVLFFLASDVTTRNGEVFTPILMEMSKLRRSGQFKKDVMFAVDMSESDVRMRLEGVFPALINKRFACAARSAQDSRLEFHGPRRIWDGRTIKKTLKGKSALYIVEDELSVSQHLFSREKATSSTKATMPVFSGHHENSSANSAMEVAISTSGDIPHDLTDVSPGNFDVNCEALMELDGSFHGMLGSVNFMESVRVAESGREDLRFNSALRNRALDEGTDDGKKQIPDEQLRGQMPSIVSPSSVSTDISGKSAESGYSSEEILISQSTALEGNVNIKPVEGPLQGGIPFRLHFEKELPKSLDFGWALFADSQPVKVWKTSQDDVLYGDNIPPGTRPGSVSVTILTQSKHYLGRTRFTYVDEEEQWLEQIVRNKTLRGKFFKKMFRECESDGSEDSDENRKHNSGNPGLSSQGVLQSSYVDVLLRLVYIAARIGEEEFIRMILSSSSGRVVFAAYKNKAVLPEDTAEANGHHEVAAYLRSITERYTKENETSQISKDINWHELARVAENTDAKIYPYEKPCKELQGGSNSDKEYFGDTETSSSDSEKKTTSSKHELQKGFCQESEREGSVSIGPSHCRCLNDQMPSVEAKGLLESRDGNQGCPMKTPRKQVDFKRNSLPYNSDAFDVVAFIEAQFKDALRGEEDMYNVNHGETQTVRSKMEVVDGTAPTPATLDALEFSFGNDRRINQIMATREVQLNMQGSCDSGIDLNESTTDPRDAVVTELQLADISDDVGTCWRELGPKLKIVGSKIHYLDDDYRSNRDKANALLIMWKQQEGRGATVGRLTDALEIIGRKSIAEKLLEPSDVLLPNDKCVKVSQGEMVSMTVKCSLNVELDSKLLLCEDADGNKFMLKAIEDSERHWNFEEIHKNKQFLETVAGAARNMGKTADQRRQESLKILSSEVQELREQLKRVRLDCSDTVSCGGGNVDPEENTQPAKEALSDAKTPQQDAEHLLQSCEEQYSLLQGIYNALIKLIGEVGQPRDDNFMSLKNLCKFTQELRDQEKTFFQKLELLHDRTQHLDELQVAQVAKLEKWIRVQQEQVQGVEKLLSTMLSQGKIIGRNQKLLKRRTEPVSGVKPSSGFGRRRCKTCPSKNSNLSQSFSERLDVNRKCNISGPLNVQRMCIVDTDKKLKNEQKHSSAN